VASKKEMLGGKDFDHKLTEHFAKEFQRKHKASLSDNKKALSKLR